MRVRLVLTCILTALIISSGAFAATHRTEFYCNTPAEKQFLQQNNGSSILGTLSRYADKGSWTYKFNISPGAICRASLDVEGTGSITLFTSTKSAVIPVNVKGKLKTVAISLTPAATDKNVFMKLSSKKELRLQKVVLSWTDRDLNMNRISDRIEALMGASSSNKLNINTRPKQPHTSFQTPTGYLPENDIRTDSVIIYRSTKPEYDSWKEKGYDTQTMYGFRTGDDYIKDYADEGQTTADGTILTCGPGSYYMVPAKRRVDAALAYFREAIDSGSTAVIPEEPEFFSQAGYSGSFKKEWLDYYKEPWQDQSSSIEARWKSEQLKGYLEYRMVKSILDDAQAKKSDVTRMVAAHSQISYYSGGIIYPHFKVLQLHSFQELVGQVWTGTARAGCRYEGVFAERTFEWGYLEYSSLYNLMRGTGKRLWFLMDPLEDNPDRTMEDYQENYEKTLIASLMFPEIDEFEVMPWPTRIYGRVPDWFSTKIGTIVNMLGDIHKQKTSEIDMGTQGIATFVADSMGWQRGNPSPSNFADFHGMTLPLFMKGIPVQVAQLERTVQPGYLKPYKVLIVSYDMLKPMSPAYNEALAAWVKDGGTIIILGGTDAYNDLPEWWKKSGFRTPQDHLLAQLGIKFNKSISLHQESEFKLVASEPNPYRNAENHKEYTLDLSDRALDDGNVYVKFEDSQKSDGWGPLVKSIILKVDGKTTVSFNTGSDEEKKYMYDDGNSQFNGSARFADAQSYWIYRFNAPKGSKIELVADMTNQFMVSTATVHMAAEYNMQKINDCELTAKYPAFKVHKSNEITAYDTDAVRLYSIDNTDLSPFFEQKVGKGTAIFAGISPKYFSGSKETADIYRAIVEYGCDKAGLEYKEQGHVGVRRGRYVAVRSFEKSVDLKGTYINVLDPGIGVLNDPVIPTGKWSVLADSTEMMQDSKPRIMLTSDRIEASSEASAMTSMLLTGPSKTKGVARISTAGKQMSSITALDSNEKKVPVETKLEDGTLFIKYNSLPEGVIIKIDWK
ncbi:MAG: hypothetical protein ACYC27_07805 [Armatimonadota bacterium]